MVSTQMIHTLFPVGTESITQLSSRHPRLLLLREKSHEYGRDNFFTLRLYLPRAISKCQVQYSLYHQTQENHNDEIFCALLTRRQTHNNDFRVVIDIVNVIANSIIKMFKVTIAACALLIATVSATPFRDCGSTSTLTAVRVPGCEVLPCIVYRGTNVSVEYDFVSAVSTNTLTTDVKGVIGGVSLPWPGRFPPACEDVKVGDCPVAVAEPITMSTLLVLSPAFPSVNAKAIWELRDESDSTLVCFEVTVKLL